MVQSLKTLTKVVISMFEPKLLAHTRDGVLSLAFNRPAKLNAIDNELARALLDALNAASADDNIRAIRVRGEGRSFCAGRDISAAPTDRDLELVQGVAQALVRCPKPVVAQVHGWTVGAGLEWMLAADIVVAAESTRFKLPEASIGVFVTGGITATLTASVGLARAKALVLLGEVFSAQEALAWGMICKVVSDELLEETGWRTASTLAALAPTVAAQFKLVFNRLGLAMFDRAIEEENRAQRLLAQDDGFIP